MSPYVIIVVLTVARAEVCKGSNNKCCADLCNYHPIYPFGKIRLRAAPTVSKINFLRNIIVLSLCAILKPIRLQ